MGLVSQVFTEADIASLSGLTAIGHTRYSTAGGR
jgi:amidophosphoribosyltransferase